MNSSTTRAVLVGLLVSVVALLPLLIDQTNAQRDRQTSIAKREEAYRANNIGVALLEQYKFNEAADHFRKALELQPKLTMARINFGIALFNLADFEAAAREMQHAIAVAPETPQPHYILGLAAKTQNRTAEAVTSFQTVLKIDSNDVGANINLGQLYSQQRKYSEAITSLRTALSSEPYNTTALYNLATALIRIGRRKEGQSVLKQFQELRDRGSGTSLGTTYLEQGRYAQAISSTGAEPELVDRKTPGVVFADVTARVLPSGGEWSFSDPSLETQNGALLAFDYDLDGDSDLLEVASAKQRLLRNDAGIFTDVTSQAGALAKPNSGVGTGAIAGDYDNDGRPDVFILRSTDSSLYHNDGNGSFSDVTVTSRLPAVSHLARAVTFVDVDHDGDLDIFIAGKSGGRAAKSVSETRVSTTTSTGGNRLLRNNGDGTFTDQTSVAKLSSAGDARAVVATDFDNRRDVDLVIASNDKVSLWKNMRDGTFRDVAQDVGMVHTRLRDVTSLAAGDVNKDGFIDFYFSAPHSPGNFALSDGKESFEIRAAPGAPAAMTNASQFIDYDNDGLLDLVTVITSYQGGTANLKLRILRNVGNGWVDVSNKTTRGVSIAITKLGTPLARPPVLVSADFDADGDMDIIFGVPGGGLRVCRNEGGNANHSLRVNLVGKVSNRSGVGAKIETSAGSLVQKLETYSSSPASAPADILFGLGRRQTADAVRVLWPAGILQAETEISANRSSSTAKLLITELDRKPSSCPYLYVWNGNQFVFVTDFMGGGEMGHLEKPGSYNIPDPNEYVRIPSDLLKPRDGRYEIRVTNELEEAVFFDQLHLLAIDHPEGVNVFPNEGLTEPPPTFKLFGTINTIPPDSARDEHGHDVRPRISQVDRQYPDDFRLHNIRGYADTHSLTLKLPKKNSAKASARDETTLLILTGWTDYAWSSDVLAASQSEKQLKPPALQVRDKSGNWQTVIENIGIPVGRPQTIVVDLTGKLLGEARELRIVTNMRIYWDQILVGHSVPDNFLKTTKLDPVIADLTWRGFSREFSPDGRQPLIYDYQKVSITSPWKVMTGHYTREGDVRKLLQKTDDMYVVSRPGDEVILSFVADKLPSLPKGWTRTFILYADGFSKEMDINSASPDQIGPLPFHGMTKYPYVWPERYPLTSEHRKYLETYNTRIVTSSVPTIAAELLERRR